MRYSKWAQQNKLRLGINASEKEDEKVVQMNDMEAVGNAKKLTQANNIR